MQVCKNVAWKWTVVVASISCVHWCDITMSAADTTSQCQWTEVSILLKHITASAARWHPLLQSSDVLIAGVRALRVPTSIRMHRQSWWPFMQTAAHTHKQWHQWIGDHLALKTGSDSVKIAQGRRPHVDWLIFNNGQLCEAQWPWHVVTIITV